MARVVYRASAFQAVDFGIAQGPHRSRRCLRVSARSRPRSSSRRSDIQGAGECGAWRRLPSGANFRPRLADGRCSLEGISLAARLTRNPDHSTARTNGYVSPPPPGRGRHGAQLHRVRGREARRRLHAIARERGGIEAFAAQPDRVHTPAISIARSCPATQDRSQSPQPPRGRRRTPGRIRIASEPTPSAIRAAPPRLARLSPPGRVTPCPARASLQLPM